MRFLQRDNRVRRFHTPVIRPRVGFSHRHRGDGKLQGSDRGTPRRGARAHPGADRAARRRAAQPRLLADPQPAGLGPRPHRQLRGALAGADDRRARAAARRARPLLRRDREPAQDPRRAADPARRRAARLHGRRPRAHARGARRGRPRRRRRGPAAARRLRLRDAARPRAPAQRDDAAAAADGRRLRAARGRRSARRRAAPPTARRRSRSTAGELRDRRPARGFAYDNERPRHAVELAAFEIDRTPVTNAAYIAVHGGDRRRAAAVLGARRRGGWVSTAMGRRDADRPRPSRHPRLLGARPTPSPAGPASGCRPSRSGRRPAPRLRGRRPGLGMDLLGLPRLSRLRGLPLPRVLRGLLRRRATRCCAAAPGRPIRSVVRPSFRNWDLPQRRQIFSGLRCARDADDRDRGPPRRRRRGDDGARRPRRPLLPTRRSWRRSTSTTSAARSCSSRSPSCHEYYPTRAEREILAERSAEIVAAAGEPEHPGRARLRLGREDPPPARARCATPAACDTYVPVDISEEITHETAEALVEEYPGLAVRGLVCDFEHAPRADPATATAAG